MTEAKHYSLSCSLPIINSNLPSRHIITSGRPVQRFLLRMTKKRKALQTCKNLLLLQNDGSCHQGTHCLFSFVVQVTGLHPDVGGPGKVAYCPLIWSRWQITWFHVTLLLHPVESPFFLLFSTLFLFSVFSPWLYTCALLPHWTHIQECGCTERHTASLVCTSALTAPLLQLFFQIFLSCPSIYVNIDFLMCW